VGLQGLGDAVGDGSLVDHAEDWAFFPSRNAIFTS
jgi:hypothetical protein